MELTHGGDWAGYRAKFGRDALDFSANVSPLGLPEGVALAIVNALPTADRYPDPLCRELRQKLSVSENVHENQILCGQRRGGPYFSARAREKAAPRIIARADFRRVRVRTQNRRL